MVIDQTNVKKIFEQLDKAMSAKGRKEELVIFGSAALMSQNIRLGPRATHDVDVVKPTFDNEMWLISAEAGEKFGLPMGWLNTAGNIFSRNFPEGWEGRTLEVFKGKSLTVKSLGRIDLICTKFNAYCDRARDTDEQDMLGLSPTKEEMEKAKNWVIGQNKSSKELVEESANEILNLLEKKRDRGRGR